MKKGHIDYDTLLVIASNLTLAEVHATPSAQKANLMASNPKTENIVWSIFERHVSRLEEKLDTSEDIL